MQQTKKEKRLHKKHQKKEKAIVKTVCTSGAFHDCVSIILRSEALSDDDLNIVCFVSKHWNSIIKSTYRLIKKSEITYKTHLNSIFVVYCLFQEDKNVRDGLVSAGKWNLLSVWSRRDYKREPLYEEEDLKKLELYSSFVNMTCGCPGASKIYSGLPSTKVKCRVCNYGPILSPTEVKIPAVKQWALTNALYMK